MDGRGDHRPRCEHVFDTGDRVALHQPGRHARIRAVRGRGAHRPGDPADRAALRPGTASEQRSARPMRILRPAGQLTQGHRRAGPAVHPRHGHHVRPAPGRHEHQPFRPAHGRTLLHDGLRRTAALPHAGRHRTAPRSQSLRPRPIPAPHETHAPRPRLPRQGHRGIPPLPHPHDGAGARRKGGPARKPRCILCRKPVPDNHTRCVKHWLNNQDQWMEDDQPVHEHCTPRRRPA